MIHLNINQYSCNINQVPFLFFNCSSLLTITLSSMKAILITLCLVCFALAQSPELIECIERNCPDQYAACKKNANCEAKLRQGADNCG